MKGIISNMKIMVSACLLGENCKYNGGNNLSKKVLEFIKGHEVISVCPEVMGGLPIPRIPAEIVNGVVTTKDGHNVDKEFRLIIIVSREFMVSGLRLVTANEGVVVAAGIWGKLKTAFTMVAIVVILIFCIAGVSDKFAIVSDILIWCSTVLTIISGGVYLKGYWKYIDTDK